MSEQAIKAQQQVQRIRRGIVDQPTHTERDVDRRLEELAEAELTARLARSAAWRA